MKQETMHTPERASRLLRDASLLECATLPERLVDRTDACAYLEESFAACIRGSGSSHALLYGPVGTGKTVVARRFAADLQSRLDRRVLVAYVNGRHATTPTMLLAEALGTLQGRRRLRGFSSWEIVQDLHRYAEAKDADIVLVLDEVDAVTRGNVDLGYVLSRFDEAGRGRGRIHAILIAQKDIRERFTPGGRSTFGYTNAHAFEAYPEDVLRCILAERAEAAFTPGRIAEAAIDAAATAAAQRGDARLGLELLRGAACLAERDGSSQVEARHVHRVSSGASHAPDLGRLSSHERAFLAALHVSETPVTTGALEARYATACQAAGTKPLCHSSFWTMMHRLHDRGLIHAQLSGKGNAGTTHLIRSLVPDAALTAMETYK